MHQSKEKDGSYMKVLFVGSNPSRANLKTEQPFIGTKSYDKLLQWIDYLDIKEYTLVNASNKLGDVALGDMNLDRLADGMIRHDVVVALGRTAEKAVRAAGRSVFFYLPHPSPRNRVLNNKYIERWYLDAVKRAI